MPVCPTCGNRVEPYTTVCPFCERRIRRRGRRGYRPRSPMHVVNLEAGMPSAEEALVRLRSALTTARQRGKRIVKIIHGYGSHGVGGTLRHVVRRELNAQTRRGAIRLVVRGEDFHAANASLDMMLAMYPALRDDPDFGRRNEGITIVLL
nr:Smr/MutS family protein [Ardenticatena sp.]